VSRIKSRFGYCSRIHFTDFGRKSRSRLCRPGLCSEFAVSENRRVANHRHGLLELIEHCSQLPASLFDLIRGIRGIAQYESRCAFATQITK
jgi:hypothetical protein